MSWKLTKSLRVNNDSRKIIFWRMLTEQQTYNWYNPYTRFLSVIRFPFNLCINWDNNPEQHIAKRRVLAQSEIPKEQNVGGYTVLHWIFTICVRLHHIDFNISLARAPISQTHSFNWNSLSLYLQRRERNAMYTWLERRMFSFVSARKLFPFTQLFATLCAVNSFNCKIIPYSYHSETPVHVFSV